VAEVIALLERNRAGGDQRASDWALKLSGLVEVKRWIFVLRRARTPVPPPSPKLDWEGMKVGVFFAGEPEDSGRDAATVEAPSMYLARAMAVVLCEGEGRCSDGPGWGGRLPT